MYVKIDDMLRDWPDLAPVRPAASTSLTLSDAELLTMAVMSALLGFTSERRWLRYADKELAGMFPRQSATGWTTGAEGVLPVHPGNPDAGLDTSLWSNDVWVVDSTPALRLSRETVTRSDAAGWAEYGYCASHSRYFWGLRLHLVCTLTGLPVMFALAGAKADERETLLGMLEAARDVTAAHPGQVIIGDRTISAAPSRRNSLSVS